MFGCTRNGDKVLWVAIGFNSDVWVGLFEKAERLNKEV